MRRKEKDIAFGEQLQRIHCAAQTRTQVELAELLGIRQSSVSDAQKRGSIPAEWLVKLLRLSGTNPEWILTGQGPRLLAPINGEAATAPAPPGDVMQSSPPEQCTSQELVTELVRRSLAALSNEV